MTGAELSERLKSIGWGAQRAFAARIGVHPVTIHKWINETHPIPRWVDRELAEYEQTIPSTGETTNEDANGSP